MKSIIIANGTLTPCRKILSELKQADLIIAADGGAGHLNQMKILPHVIIGDLDSIDPATLDFYRKKKIPIITHPPRKDQTDTELCIDYALEKKSDEIVFLGVVGHRLDHTLANIFLLRKMADLGIPARIMDAHNEIYLVLSDLTLYGSPQDLFSIIPISDKVTGMTLSGLEYPLTDKTLYMGTALGVSNWFTGTKASVHIDSGAVLVTRSQE
ncbi:MAG: thiamine diphosphokinase [Desulfobacter sp.]|nr:thiamine diphosphokinase [Desulfobacter sp.]WDP85514.1 MAG: thiamine diphosphokinase [Desulfobacter sp.]